MVSLRSRTLNQWKFSFKGNKRGKAKIFLSFFFLDTKVTDEIKRIMKSGISTNIANPSVGLTKDPTSEFDGRMIPKINDWFWMKERKKISENWRRIRTSVFVETTMRPRQAYAQQFTYEWWQKRIIFCNWNEIVNHFNKRTMNVDFTNFIRVNFYLTITLNMDRSTGADWEYLPKRWWV